MKLKKNNGFSLIELIIVIAIMGILLAIVSPFFMRWRHNANFREAVQDFTSDIANCKQSAMAENRRYQIVIAGNNYQIWQENAPGAGAFTMISNKSPANISGQVTITGASNPTITMESRGTTTNSTVTMNHAALSRNATINISIMGRIRVNYL